MEDETHGVPIGEFIGLWPKMNTTAKGVTRTSLRHKDCKSCLFEKQMQIAQIRSENHHIYSLNLIKTSLSPYDDKRYVLTDGCHTVAYGN